MHSDLDLRTSSFIDDLVDKAKKLPWTKGPHGYCWEKKKKDGDHCFTVTVEFVLPTSTSKIIDRARKYGRWEDKYKQKKNIVNVNTYSLKVKTDLGDTLISVEGTDVRIQTIYEEAKVIVDAKEIRKKNKEDSDKIRKLSELQEVLAGV